MHMLMSFVRDGEITGAAIFSKRMLIASLPLTAFFITIPLAITADDALSYCYQYRFGHLCDDYFLLSSGNLQRNSSPRKAYRCPASLSGNQAEVLKREKDF